MSYPQPNPSEPKAIGGAENYQWPQVQYHLPIRGANAMHGCPSNFVMTDANFSSKYPGGGTHVNFQSMSRDNTFSGLTNKDATLLESFGVGSSAFPSFDQTTLQGLGDRNLSHHYDDVTYPQDLFLCTGNFIEPLVRNEFWTGPEPNAGSVPDIALGEIALASSAINFPQGNTLSGLGRTGFDSTLNSLSRNDIPSSNNQLNLHLQTEVDAPKRRKKKGNNSESIHRPLAPLNTCSECDTNFGTNLALNNHAKAANHAAHKCTCQATFSRIDCLNRHIRDFSAAKGGGEFPCRYCTKYAGDKAFLRKDHLAQHLRGYHKIEI